MEQEFNAKCTHCGKEYKFEAESGKALCLACKKEFDIKKARSLYDSIYAAPPEEKKVASGQAYLDVESILDRVEFYLEKEDYEKAKSELDGALELTNTDFRVYFGYVRVETKNLTDLKNTSHKEYLNKAIGCASDEEKGLIRRLYADFYHKSQLTEEELEIYEQEENQAKKQKLEKRLKDIIPNYMKLEKNLKLFAILSAVGLIPGPILIILGFVFSSVLMLMLGSVLVCVGYLFFRRYFDGRRKNTEFNALLDLYDAIDSFNLSTSAKKQLLDLMKEAAKSYAGTLNAKSNLTVTTQLSQYLAKLDSEAVHEFLKKCKVYADYYEE